MRETGGWTYAGVNLAHIIGIAMTFGAVLLLDLRLLGLWRHVPLAPVATIAAPMVRAGFLLAAVSGLGLISANATEYVGNPFLLIKFAAIAFGLLNIVVLSRFAAWQQRDIREPTARESSQLSVAGGISLASWLIAVGAGRLIGYW